MIEGCAAWATILLDTCTGMIKAAALKHSVALKEKCDECQAFCNNFTVEVNDFFQNKFHMRELYKLMQKSRIFFSNLSL